MDLILVKIDNIQFETEKRIKLSTKKLAALKSINALLKQIDFTVEEVPIKSKEKLERLLTSLKGKKLNKHEQNLIPEIIEH